MGLVIPISILNKQWFSGNFNSADQAFTAQEEFGGGSFEHVKWQEADFSRTNFTEQMEERNSDISLPEEKNFNHEQNEQEI